MAPPQPPKPTTPPISRLLGVLPSGRQGSLPQSADRPLFVPPRVRLLQSQHVSHPEPAQSLPELLVLAVEGVRNHSPEGHAFGHRMFHELSRYLELGAELGIVLAALEVVRWRVGLDRKRVVDSLLGKQAAYAHHPVVGLAYVGKPLLSHVGGLFAPFAIPMLVYDQNALLVGGRPLIIEQKL